MIDTIIHGDCLEVMPTIKNKSVDMVLADLPYGVTACKWDTPLPLDELWNGWWRICKGVIVLMATQPFASILIMSQLLFFRYDIIWQKTNIGGGFLNAKRMPLRFHENILVFYKKQPTYNPQFTEGNVNHGRKAKQIKGIYGKLKIPSDTPTTKKYPKSIISFSRPQPTLHPTQKPVALFEYLIRTYTNEGDSVLDPTCGVGTTAVASKRCGRHYVCIEKEGEYVAIARKRLAEML